MSSLTHRIATSLNETMGIRYAPAVDATEDIASVKGSVVESHPPSRAQDTYRSYVNFCCFVTAKTAA